MTNTKINYLDDFDPAEYLDDYFIVEPEIEDVFATQFMIKALKNMPSNLLTLDFSSGPTLYVEATLAPQSREIHMCDYVPASLDVLRSWVDDSPEAFNWTPYIKMILKEEGEAITPNTVAQRIAEMRRKITNLMRCNALLENPLGDNRIQYDLVVTQSVTESVASNLSEWIQVMRNISTLVSPGGWLLIGVTTDTQGYYVKEKFFSCVDLTNEDIRRGYMENGYDSDSFYLETISSPGERGYSGITCAVARKFSHRSKE
ncbi:guanitoxin biosynthesis pre-guanitoxin forming N-methyltransferase GntF [Anaerolineales bacterium HSG25]|nr:guanitoxin biosynthesis pre-guanitoxin forming N-methyltransferase GntF [Anaerolineales bacterium HSG25]